MRPWNFWPTGRRTHGSTRSTQVNPTYGEGYALVAHHLVLNRRYEDGVAYYRKAIEADPQLWSARSELGINLMRLGQEDEPRQQLEMCYDNGYRERRDRQQPAPARQLQEFCDLQGRRRPSSSCKKRKPICCYPYFRDRNAEARHRDLREEIQDEASRARCRWKSIRTTKTSPCAPWACRDWARLGVTFGEVVAMDSPSGRKPGDFNWASTLWHEMSHVFILTATNHRVPRWFTEGLAVHEETEANPGVGRPHHAGHPGRDSRQETAAGRRARSRLCSARVSESQVIVSYYQAGRICDYIQEPLGRGQAARHGALLRQAARPRRR